MLVQAALLKAIKYCGSKQKKLAELIGEDPDKVSYWLNRAKQIPFHIAIAIEAATDGVVSRYDLAPYARLQTGRALEEYYQAADEVTISERVAMGIALENAIGNRKGSRSDLVNEYSPEDAKSIAELGSQLRRKCAQLKGKTSTVVAKEIGFASRDTYLRAKKVVQKGIFKLVQAMDKKHISISIAADIANLLPDEQSQLLAQDVDSMKALLAALRDRLKKKKNKNGGTLADNPKFLKDILKDTRLLKAEDDTQKPLRLPLLGLLIYCDASGYFPWQPQQLKDDLLPHTDIDFAAILAILAELGIAKKCERKGIAVGQILFETLIQVE